VTIEVQLQEAIAYTIGFEEGRTSLHRTAAATAHMNANVALDEVSARVAFDTTVTETVTTPRSLKAIDAKANDAPPAARGSMQPLPSLQWTNISDPLWPGGAFPALPWSSWGLQKSTLAPPA
jgi:hypothetical protein